MDEATKIAARIEGPHCVRFGGVSNALRMPPRAYVMPRVPAAAIGQLPQR